MDRIPNHTAIAPSLLTVRGACARLSLSRTTVYGLLRAGELEARKIGRRTMISTESVDAMLQRLPVARFAGSGVTRVQS